MTRQKQTSVQTLAQLLASGQPGKALKSWNGMRVLVMDSTTGQVLVNAGADEVRDAASLTKLMTAYLAFESKFDVKAAYITPKHASERRVEGQKRVGLEGSHLIEGKKYTGEELLRAMLTASDNGAATVIAEALGPNTLKRMNDTAKRLGMANTHFDNPHGLPYGDTNESTPRDMATLIRRIHQDFPKGHKDFPKGAEDYMTDNKVTYGGYTKRANTFLNDDSGRLALPNGYEAAAKTGLTKNGHNIAARITGPNGKKLDMVVMSAPVFANLNKFREAGIPSGLLPEGQGSNGNRVRDALVRHVSVELMEGRVRGVSAPQPAPTPPAKAAEVAPKPPAPPAPAKPAAQPAQPKSMTLSHADLKAVQNCKTTINSYAFPGAEATAAKVTVPKQPLLLTEYQQKLASLEAQVKNAKNSKKAALTKEIQGLRHKIAVKQDVVKELTALEDQTDERIYTKANYDKTILRAQTYLDAFVDGLPTNKLPPGGKPALKQRMRAIAEGAAGMETGWNPEIVKGAANRRPHTGVYQTEWAYLGNAKKEIESNPAMSALLNNFPEDKAFLKLVGKWQAAEGLPTTSFAGQGIAFAGMTAASFERFLEKGGKPQEFNGDIPYEDHMMGATGALRFRNQLKVNPEKQKPGESGIGKSAYNANYLIENNPTAQLNDLNPNRITHDNATARDVKRMMDDKYVHQRNKLEGRMNEAKAEIVRVEGLTASYPARLRDAQKNVADLEAEAKLSTKQLEEAKLRVTHLEKVAKPDPKQVGEAKVDVARLEAKAKLSTKQVEEAKVGVTRLQEEATLYPERLREATANAKRFEAFLPHFEQAFLPQWNNNSGLKEHDIARMKFQKETGFKLRKGAKEEIEKMRQGNQVSAVAVTATLCDILKPMPPFIPGLGTALQAPPKK